MDDLAVTYEPENQERILHGIAAIVEAHIPKEEQALIMDNAHLRAEAAIEAQHTVNQI